MYKTLFICSLILSVPFLEARRSGGGGGASRGSSGARTNSAAGGGFNPNRGGNSGGFNPNQGGGNNFGNRPAGGFQQPNYGNQGGFHGPSNTGFQRPQNFNNQGWNRSPGFSNTGSGLGSASRGSTFKHALAGAAIGTIGGLLVFEAGKAIINSATSPFHHQGRDYYFDQQNYRGRTDLPRCSVPLSQLTTITAPPATPVVTDGNSTTPAQAPEQVLQNMQFRDGSKPREVVWSCNMGEICCGTDCCPAPAASPNSAGSYGGSHGGSSAGWIALLGGLALFLFY